MHSAQAIVAASLADARVMIQENLEESDAWVIRGVLAIYNRQTADEQQSQCTKHYNKVGFSGVDSQILSSFAQQILRHRVESHPRFASPLSPRQLEIARAKMRKYAGQLARVAREKRAERQEAAV